MLKFFSDGFITALVVNLPERKLVKHTFVPWIAGLLISLTKRLIVQVLFLKTVGCWLGIKAL